MSTRSFSTVRMLRDFIELDLRVGFPPSASKFKFRIRLKSPPNIQLVFSLSSGFESTLVILSYTLTCCVSRLGA